MPSFVFLTSSGEHVLEGYRVYALGYFIKPLEEHRSEFAETLKKIKKIKSGLLT